MMRGFPGGYGGGASGYAFPGRAWEREKKSLYTRRVERDMLAN